MHNVNFRKALAERFQVEPEEIYDVECIAGGFVRVTFSDGALVELPEPQVLTALFRSAMQG